MFNSVTAESLKTLPSVEGVDSKRMPQLLSKVYAHIVGLKTKYEVGVLNFEPKEIEEDYKILRDLTFTLELYLESGRFEDNRDAIAFVAAMSHKLMSKLNKQPNEPLTPFSLPSDLLSILLFVIGGYIADAEELSYEIKRNDEESKAAWRLKQDICYLVKGKLKMVFKPLDTKSEQTTIEDYAQDLMWSHLSYGIRELANLLLWDKYADYEPYFNKVLELAVYVDENTHTKYDYPGITRLARLLLMASRVLEKQSVVKCVESYITTKEQHDLLMHIVVDRPFLWQNHIDAIKKGILNEGVSSVITFPTGAGKSTLVELKIVQHVAKGDRVLYIVPTHALEDQVKNNMARLLGTEDYKKLNIGKEFSFDETEDQPVIVMTPERCSTLLALNPLAFEGTKLVIMDEFHIIGENGHRSLGAMYCMVSLLTILSEADYVLVSAMVENGTEISDWIKDATGRDCLDLSTAWKPTSQLQGCIVYSMSKRDELQHLANEDKRTRGERKGPSSDLQRRLLAEPLCLFSLCNTWESNSFDDYYLTPVLDHQVLLGVNKYWQLIGNRNQVAKELAKKFAAIGYKTIVFVENPLQANSLVKQLNSEIGVEQLPDNLKKRLEIIAMELGDTDCSYIDFEMGAIPHHSQLLPEERQVMETLFKTQSDIMIATPTLAQGVNLPVDVVLIAGEDRYDSESKGRDRMDAHEILNAAGRAGRAGFRSQGAAILVSNKVIGIEKNKLTNDWFDLKSNIFSKGDQCLMVEDPFGKLVEESYEEENISVEQKMVLMKLSLLGENERKVLSKSFYEYQLKRDNKESNSFEERMLQLSSLYEGEENTPLLELSLKTGVDNKLLTSFYDWLGEGLLFVVYTVEEVLDLYCSWLEQTPSALSELLTYESTVELLSNTFSEGRVINENFISELWKVLKMYINGSSLKEISFELNEKQNDHYITATRKFVLKVIPELSYAFSVLAMVHVQYLKDIGMDEEEIPFAIKNFATCLKEGVSSEEMLQLKADKHLMRVEAHLL